MDTWKTITQAKSSSTLGRRTKLSMKMTFQQLCGNGDREMSRASSHREDKTQKMK